MGGNTRNDGSVEQIKHDWCNLGSSCNILRIQWTLWINLVLHRGASLWWSKNVMDVWIWAKGNFICKLLSLLWSCYFYALFNFFLCHCMYGEKFVPEEWGFRIHVCIPWMLFKTTKSYESGWLENTPPGNLYSQQNKKAKMDSLCIYYNTSPFVVKFVGERSWCHLTYASLYIDYFKKLQYR